MRKPAPGVEERSFGRAVGGARLLLAAYDVWRGRTSLAIGFAVVGLALVVLAQIAPRALALPSRVWWTLARALGWVNIRLILTVFFVLVLVPVGFVLRALGRDPLARRATGSSWTPFTSRRDPRHYERMY